MLIEVSIIADRTPRYQAISPPPSSAKREHSPEMLRRGFEERRRDSVSAVKGGELNASTCIFEQTRHRTTRRKRKNRILLSVIRGNIESGNDPGPGARGLSPSLGGDNPSGEDEHAGRTLRHLHQRFHCNHGALAETADYGLLGMTFGRFHELDKLRAGIPEPARIPGGKRGMYLTGEKSLHPRRIPREPGASLTPKCLESIGRLGEVPAHVVVRKQFAGKRRKIVCTCSKSVTENNRWSSAGSVSSAMDRLEHIASCTGHFCRTAATRGARDKACPG